MTAPLIDPVDEQTLYPDDDGQPMAENTRQYEWIVTIKGNLDNSYPVNANVFVAGDLLWYAVEGEPTLCVAPDIMVVFGRPKGYRGSYMQWREGGIAPQVAFEVLSPSNRVEEMTRKFEFYQRFGVEEYYIYDPDRVVTTGFRRVGSVLQEIESMDGWVSPRLGIRFDLSGPELVLWRADGERFLTFAELEQEWKRSRAQAEESQHQAREAEARAEQAETHAEQERHQREEAEMRAEQAETRAAQEQRQREEAQTRTEQERRQREEAQARSERLAARLRELGIDPEA